MASLFNLWHKLEGTERCPWCKPAGPLWIGHTVFPGHGLWASSSFWETCLSRLHLSGCTYEPLRISCLKCCQHFEQNLLCPQHKFGISGISFCSCRIFASFWQPSNSLFLSLSLTTYSNKMLADTLESLRQHSKLEMLALFCLVSNFQFNNNKIKKYIYKRKKAFLDCKFIWKVLNFLQTNCFRYIDFLICVWLIGLSD